MQKFFKMITAFQITSDLVDKKHRDMPLQVIGSDMTYFKLTKTSEFLTSGQSRTLSVFHYLTSPVDQRKK